MAEIAVTGAGGYVGSCLVDFLRAQGHRIHRLVRRPDAADPGDAAFSLDRPPDPQLFRSRQITVLIHAAYDFSVRGGPDIHRINVAGSRLLREAAMQGGVQRVILISTLSAFKGCPSLYGQAKLAIERDILDQGGAVVRSGLVYGEPARAMFGRIQERAEKGGWMPVLRHPAPLYLTHHQDLSELVHRLIMGPWPPPRALLIAAARQPWTLSTITKGLAAAQGRSLRPIPVPWPLVWLGLRTAELLGLRLTFKSDSVLALIKNNPDIERADLRHPEVRFREFAPADKLSDNSAHAAR